MQLWQTVCSTDWKGRPLHNLRLLACSDQRDWLIERQDADVAEWQAEELRAWNADVREAGEPERTEWKVENETFEIQGKTGPDSDLREFCLSKADGNVSTLVYHILEEYPGETDKS